MRTNTLKKDLRRDCIGLSFVLPSFTIMAVFLLFPIIMVVYYGFTKYNGSADPVWNDFANFIRIFSDPAMKHSFRNTMIFILVTVPLQSAISLVLAAILAQNFQNRFGQFVRSSLFIPVICSATLVAMIWYFMFSSDKLGFINVVIGWFGAKPIDWLGDGNRALIIVCMVNVWKQIGYYLIIYYAAIMDIPRDLFEAAAVDGATKFQQFFHITLPNLKSINYLVVTLGTIQSFQTFDIAYTMTGGGPGFSTMSLVYRVYVECFKNWDIGYSCAIAFVMLLIIFALTLLQRWMFSEKVTD